LLVDSVNVVTTVNLALRDNTRANLVHQCAQPAKLDTMALQLEVINLHAVVPVHLAIGVQKAQQFRSSSSVVASQCIALRVQSRQLQFPRATFQLEMALPTAQDKLLALKAHTALAE